MNQDNQGGTTNTGAKPAEVPQQTVEEQKGTPLTRAQKDRLQLPVPTANAKVIRDLMVGSKVRGNYKDYVVISGNRILDWSGSYDIVNEHGAHTSGVDGVALIHKSALAKIIGDKLASEFWHPVLGRRSKKRQNAGGAK